MRPTVVVCTDSIATDSFAQQCCYFDHEMTDGDPSESSNRYTIGDEFPYFFDGVPNRCIDFYRQTFLFWVQFWLRL